MVLPPWQVCIGAAGCLPKVDGDVVLNKFSGEHKKRLDCGYVKWCVKSCRPTSMGEVDKEFRTWVQVWAFPSSTHVTWPWAAFWKGVVYDTNTSDVGALDVVLCRQSPMGGIHHHARRW